MATIISDLRFHVVQSTDVSGYVKVSQISTNLPPLVEPNWVDNPTLATSWQTDIGRGQETGAEDRRGRQARPRRAISYQVTGFPSLSEECEPNYAARVLTSTMALSTGPIPVPIVMDRMLLLSDFDPEESEIINCDFQYRRVFVGQRLAIVPDRYNRPIIQGFRVDYISVIISSLDIDKNKITVIGLDQKVLKGARVYPMLDCNFMSNASFRRLTNTVLDGDLSLSEVGSASTLPPSNLLPLVSDFKINPINGKPIFDVKLTGEITLLVNRSGQFVSLGNGGIETLVGDRPKFGFSSTVIWKTRKEFMRLLQWFDASKGRLKVFSFRNPFKLYDLKSVESNNSVIVKPLAYSFDLKKNWPVLCLLYESGEEVFLNIDTVNIRPNGDFLITTLETFNVANIKLATSGHVGRFNSDTLTETWFTEDKGSAGITVIETFDEANLGFNVF